MNKIATEEMPQTAFCINCGCISKYRSVMEEAEAEVRGVQFSYTEMLAICEKCGEELYVPEINDSNAQAREDAYREAAELITVDFSGQFPSKQNLNKFHIPSGAKNLILQLRYEYHEAYVVGGCVRDNLLGKEPKDWDICTSATPDEVKDVMHRMGVRTIDTGLKHGTVTADMGPSGQYEITTFRCDGVYSDGRHPDSVEFTESIYKDLARRDFTINAMAYNGAGLIDPFHGLNDLKAGVIRCVGNADDRFQEDALRILRALRFASVYGLRIEDQTAKAIHRNAQRLDLIAKERINSELCKILLGTNVLNVLLEFSDVITTIIPELAPCVGFEQNNKYHQYTVYEHIAHAVANYTGSDLSVKVALLLHDIGKPCCYTEDHNGGHFYGHGVYSHDIAEVVLDRLRFDTKTRNEVLCLVLDHDAVIEPTPKTVRRWLNRLGSRQFGQLLDVRMADILAHAEGTQESRIEKCIAIGAIMAEIIEQEQCFKLKDLAVNGRDVMGFGVGQGKAVGSILNKLLSEVMDGSIQNDRRALLTRIGEIVRDESETAVL